MNHFITNNYPVITNNYSEGTITLVHELPENTNPEVLLVEANTKLATIDAYIDLKLPFNTIIATHASLSKLINAVPDCTDYYLIIDDYEELFNTPINSVFENYINFKNCAFVTTWPLIDSFILDEIKHLKRSEIIQPIKTYINKTDNIDYELSYLLKSNKSISIFTNDKLPENLDPNINIYPLNYDNEIKDSVCIVYDKSGRSLFETLNVIYNLSTILQGEELIYLTSQLKCAYSKDTLDEGVHLGKTLLEGYSTLDEYHLNIEKHLYNPNFRKLYVKLENNIFHLDNKRIKKESFLIDMYNSIINNDGSNNIYYKDITQNKVDLILKKYPITKKIYSYKELTNIYASKFKEAGINWSPKIIKKYFNYIEKVRKRYYGVKTTLYYF